MLALCDDECQFSCKLQPQIGLLSLQFKISKCLVAESTNACTMHTHAVNLAGIFCVLLLQHTHQGQILHTIGLPNDAVQTGTWHATKSPCCIEVVQAYKENFIRCGVINEFAE